MLCKTLFLYLSATIFPNNMEILLLSVLLQSVDISECDDLIDAAEAAFDEYLAECTAEYSELCSFRAQSRK